MLHSLTRYLLRYKKLTVPHVGTLRLVRHPASLKIADKIIEPPHYVVEVDAEEKLSDHQLHFLAAVYDTENDEAERRLRACGEKMKEQIAAGEFEWEGIGILSQNAASFPLKTFALEPVTAEKIIRQDAAHSVLVGDRQLSSAQITSERLLDRQAVKRRSVWVVTGWVLLLLSILFIALWLYLGKFKVAAAGSKLPPLSEWVRQQEMPLV